MNILEKVKKYIIEFQNIGLEPNLMVLDKARIQMLNYLSLGLFLIALSTIIIFFEAISIANNLGLFFLLIFPFLLVYLNYKKKTFTALVLFHAILPMMALTSLVIYGKISSDETFIGLICALGFISFSKPKQQRLVIIWSLLCYVTGGIINYFYGPLVDYKLGIVEGYVFGFWVILLVVSLTGFLVRTNYKFSREILSLTRILEKRNNELDISNEALEEINADLKNFAYVASHDLKSPLRSIISFQKLIEKEVKPLENKKLNEFLNYSTTSAKQMQNVLDDLLEYTKLSQEIKTELTEIILFKDIVNQIIIETKNAFDKDAVIKLEGNVEEFNGISSQIKLVLQNIIGNGIKYNESEVPEILIKTEAKKEELVIKVKDNGIGIAPEFLEQIFEPFQRLHTQEKYEGTGFGLAITKRIVEKIGGSIRVNSSIGEGSEFIIFLPKV